MRKNLPGMVRQCRTCDAEITVTEQMCKYGKYVCGPCLSEQAADYVRRNREKKRAWNQVYQSKITDKRAAKTKAYRERHPDRKAAYQAVQTATRNGLLKRLACEVCSFPKAHAHHDDYSKPLDVKWLCHTHHMELHAMIAEGNKP
jgi:predicted nucleotidyltransferase